MIKYYNYANLLNLALYFIHKRDHSFRAKIRHRGLMFVHKRQPASAVTNSLFRVRRCFPALEHGKDCGFESRRCRLSFCLPKMRNSVY